MVRVFLDSNVLFSAAYSPRGRARELLMMAIRKEISLILSPLVLKETDAVLVRNAPEYLSILELVTRNIPFTLSHPTRQDIHAAARYVAQKDAPIVAAARKARADYLVTYDREHLLKKPEITRVFGVKVVTPEELMRQLSLIHSY